jgi:hypothetical protein
MLKRDQMAPSRGKVPLTKSYVFRLLLNILRECFILI